MKGLPLKPFYFLRHGETDWNLEHRAPYDSCSNRINFQAKDFYIKHGYEVFGVLDDCPKGHKRYYMKKVLG